MADIYTPTQPTPITEFSPPYPDAETQDPDVFAEHANRQGLWQPVLAQGANTLAAWFKANADGTKTNAEIAAASATVAQGASNYEGKWSTLTGALAKGKGVSHTVNGTLTGWVSAVDIADVTLSEPGLDNSDWFPAGYVQPPYQLYKGPWEEQTGDGIPPLWVAHGGNSNDALQSEGLDQSGTWGRTRLADVPDSGIAAPTIDGQSFGNYFKIIPDTATGVHSLRQSFGGPVPDGSCSFIIRDGGYPNVSIQMDDDTFVQLPNPRPTANINLTAGVTTTVGGGFAEIEIKPLSDGGYFVDVSWRGITDLQSMTLYVLNGSSFSFAGNGSDGVLMTRVHVGPPGSRYVKTTTEAVPYALPKIYELQKFQADVTATEPGTDETVWKVVGTGGGGASTATAPEQVFTSADQDGSSNIAVELDASEYTEWQLDFNGSPLPNTSGAFNINLHSLPDSIDNLAVYYLRIKRGGRKTLNLTAENESASSISISFIESPVYRSTDGGWDIVSLQRWPGNPNTLYASLIDGR